LFNKFRDKLKESSENKNRVNSLELQMSNLKFELEEAKILLEEEIEKRQFYQRIADFTYGWEMWIETGGVVKYCSPSCSDLTGFSSNQIVSAKSISELLVYELDVEKFNEFLLKSVDQILLSQSLEFRIMTRTKQIRWCIMNVRGVYDKFGKYLGVRVSIQDITRLKRAMGNIKELEDGKEFQNRNKARLQNQLDLKDRELVSYLLQLSQKNEIITKATHFLKNQSSDASISTRENMDELLQLMDSSSKPIDWADLEIQLERLYPGFLQSLIGKHPTISFKEKKLCAFLRLGLSSKEISGLLNITPKSVEIARVRLRKKLKLSGKIRLVNYLNQF
jgi:PAS domain S-box-containing protein